MYIPPTDAKGLTISEKNRLKSQGCTCQQRFLPIQHFLPHRVAAENGAPSPTFIRP